VELILGGGGGRGRRGTEKEGSILSSYRNGGGFKNLVDENLFPDLKTNILWDILGSYLI
jgi:hypothetical protein